MRTLRDYLSEKYKPRPLSGLFYHVARHGPAVRYSEEGIDRNSANPTGKGQSSPGPQQKLPSK